MDDSPVTIASTLRQLVDKLPLSSLKQLDELAGDAVRIRRLRRLVGVLEQAHEIAQDRGIPPNDMRVLADHVGLPWLDKASLRDERELQRAWACLFVTITTSSDDDLHGRHVRVLGEMEPWDCQVLDYVVRNRVAMMLGEERPGYIAIPTPREDIVSALSSDGQSDDRTLFSIENLLRLGCLVSSTKAPLGASTTAWGVVAEVVSITMMGVNFYCAASGQELEALVPKLSEDDIRRRSGVADTDLLRRGSP